MPARREIPYNYTSLTDREIILKYADTDTWNTIETLRSERITGRSAKLLLEIFGDLFIIDRNPYIFYDYIDHPKKILKLRRLHQQRLDSIRSHAAGNPDTAKLIRKTEMALEPLYHRFSEFEQKKRRIKKILSAATSIENIRFAAFHKVSHATDATDWRVAYPECVVYPDSIQELASLVLQAKKAGLKIIVRGGGTGLTGGAVPLQSDTLVINTEKLNRIGQIESVASDGRQIPVIETECGVVTDDVTRYCAEQGYVFATDPTSAWASTIGGNIAENAGGKKCVMWGTCIDNLYDFKLINAEGQTLTVRRHDHPHRKIEDGDDIRFDIYTQKPDGLEQLHHSIRLNSSDIRKKGLGKDITNKALNGVPGIQKEGGDGIIVSARFVLYTPFHVGRTLCLEFYGRDMINASKAIVAIRERFSQDTGVFLTALEHFDDKYIQAIQYSNKSERIDRPKAVLLIDAESNSIDMLDAACDAIIQLVQPYETEVFTARSEGERKNFWKDRKNLGAIARHTNAFKLNEDIVIPLDKLPEFSEFIDALNIRKELENELTLIDKISALVQNLEKLINEDITAQKLVRYRNTLQLISERITSLITNLFIPTIAMMNSHSGPAVPLYKTITGGEIIQQTDEKIIRPFEALFQNDEPIIEKFRQLVKDTRRRKIIIATHMHAGDGNSHINIPVLSSDPAMMKDADATVDMVMSETIRLGGVVSGEHGIGITKLKYLEPDIIHYYAVYKAEHDPEDLFNPGKLRADFPFDQVYTPSFNLLEIEAFALTATDLHHLSESIANCVRCAKCKDVCNTHFPAGNMLYSPRNKILGVGLIIEAVLYDVLTSKQLSFRHFEKLQEISSHCTMCHQCAIPCPVKIDFGKVTLEIRSLLKQRHKSTGSIMTALTYHFLERRNPMINTLYRWLLFKGAYSAQRVAYNIYKPFRHIRHNIFPALQAMMQGPLPKTGTPTLREYLKLNDNRYFYTLNPVGEPKYSVFYFPGCGSERMFPDISIAAVSMLVNHGIRVVIPPEYTCCGYPFQAAGNIAKAEKIRTGNILQMHKIAGLSEYMHIEAVLVTCGTCFEMLESYGLNSIFSNSRIMDAAAFLTSHQLIDPVSNATIMFHEPCHSSLKNEDFQKIIQGLTGQPAIVPANCCGESGTLSLSAPQVSNTIRTRKRINILSLQPMKKQEILTVCPSCVQGLSKIDDEVTVQGKHLIVWLAEQKLGADWKRDFLRKAPDLIERTLLS